MTLSRLARFTAMLLISVLWLNTLDVAAAKPVDPAAMKAKVQSRGVGQGVRVTLADKSEAKGVIVSIGDQAFTVKPKGAAQPQEIQYAQVTGVHGDKMGTGTKVIIVVAIAGATIGIIAAVWVHKFNNGFKNITFPPISSLDLRKSTNAFAANSLETA
jgi:ABC-type phosphate transport system permease subunit